MCLGRRIMRIALVVHAFPPHSCTGVEVYSESLAGALAARGHQVEVFAMRVDETCAFLSQWREERAGFCVTWLCLDKRADQERSRRKLPGASAALARFLEREQPDVVHFQHMIGFGEQAIDVARAAGSPVLYTAHDMFPISDEYTLLAADLSPVDPTDFEQAARCRLARGVLDQRLTAHDGFLVPGDSPSNLVAEVSRVLKEDGNHVLELAEEIRQDVTLRVEALSRVDHLEAPTQYLADLLSYGGVQAEIVVQPLGIDQASLSKQGRIGREPEDKLRVLYLGGYYEHKGVHVLLEAYAGMGDTASLTLRGCSGSSSYKKTLKRLAEGAGATLAGSFRRDELDGLLANADVLVLPSIWSENAPFVIREAFASGLPVIASDTPALRESVRDGQDGVLFPPGDATALRLVLNRLAEDSDFLARLTSGVKSPLSIEVDAERLEGCYADLLQAHTERDLRRRKRLPESLHGFAERFDDLSRKPTRELIELAARGLEELAGKESVSADSILLLTGSGQRLRERLAETRRATQWRAGVNEDREAAARNLERSVRDLEKRVVSETRRADWKAELLDEREARLAWKDEQILGQERTLEALRGQLALAQESEGSLAEELTLSERTRIELDGRIANGNSALRVLETERDWIRESLSAREAHVGELGREIEDERAQRDLRAIEFDALQVRCDDLHAELSRLSLDRHAAREHESFLEEELKSTAQELVTLGKELDWRSTQMRDALGEGSGLGQKIFGAQLYRRLDAWREHSSGADSEGGDE
ncbi:MAG: glycosyltransferase involved in cell wall biosynthesis [Planctomycetota bacterium]|jgi:glycosyltransferase involved in cell wall biosynthesis